MPFAHRTLLLIAAVTVTHWLAPGAGAGEHDAGAAQFRAYCAVCHGAEGRGDGVLREELKRPPSDLTALSRSNGGSFPETVVYQVIDGRRTSPFHGSREMPVWGLRFRIGGADEAQTQERIDALVRYVERIQDVVE